MALDARTGRRLWHYQIVHHDVWDYDLPVAPKLLTIRQNGRRRDVVAQATKQGFLFVFDRVTGEPIWPIEERPVPQSDVPGEQTSPTQPFPTKPAPFARQSFTEKDINPYLPADERRAIGERLRSYRNEGLFTPPSFRGSIEMPGHSGGTNWGGVGGGSGARRALCALHGVAGDAAAVPAGRQRAGHLAHRAGDHHPGGGVGAAHAPGERGAGEGTRCDYTSPYDFMFSSTYLSPIGPPWSEIAAYDLNTGDIKWRVPHGRVAAPAEIGIPGGQRRALAARRVAADLRRPSVRGVGIGQDAARLRPADRARGLDAPAACRVRRRAGLVRDRRPPVHRPAGGRRPRLEPGALSDPSGSA